MGMCRYSGKLLNMLKRPFALNILNLCLVLVAGLLIYGWVAWRGDAVIGFSDSIDYLLMADFYHGWLRGEYPAQASAVFRGTRFPPLFPLILGVFGGGTHNQHAAYITSSGLVIASALCLWWWIFADTASRTKASFVALATLTYPGFFLLALLPVSEPLCIAMMAMAFALLSQRELTTSRLVTAAMIIGMSVLARTAMLALLIALPCWLATRRDFSWQKFWLPTALAWAPATLWFLYRYWLGADSYTNRITPDAMSEKLGGFPELLWLQPYRLFDAAVSNWGAASDSLFLTLSTALITLLAIIGCIVRLRDNKLDAWFLPAYIGMILLWPFPFELPRFLVVIFPCVLICVISAADKVTRAIQLRRPQFSQHAGIGSVIALIALCAIPTHLKYFHRATLPIDEALSPHVREAYFFEAKTDEEAIRAAEVATRFIALAKHLREVMADDECVYSTVSKMVSLYGGVPSLDYPFDLKDVDDARSRLIDCHFFLLISLEVATFDVPPMYPINLMSGWVDPVLVSKMNIAGQELIAVALLERKHEDGASESSDRE